jgi:hypothetical protein
VCACVYRGKCSYVYEYLCLYYVSKKIHAYMPTLPTPTHVLTTYFAHFLFHSLYHVSSTYFTLGVQLLLICLSCMDRPDLPPPSHILFPLTRRSGALASMCCQLDSTRHSPSIIATTTMSCALRQCHSTTALHGLSTTAASQSGCHVHLLLALHPRSRLLHRHCAQLPHLAHVVLMLPSSMASSCRPSALDTSPSPSRMFSSSRRAPSPPTRPTPCLPPRHH